MSRLVLINGTIFDGVSTEPLTGHSVVVKDDVILDIIPDADTSPGAGVLDCRGKWILPGLIDAHVHIGAVDHNSHGQHRRYSSAYLAFRIAERLREILNNGFTTVRDAGGGDIGFKQAVEEGLIEGPRLLLSMRPLSQTGGHGDSRSRYEPGDYFYEGEFGMTHVVADGVDGVRKATREQLRRGADVIKVVASGGAASSGNRIDSTQYSVGELRAAHEEASAAGSYVMAHALPPAAIRNCLEAGIRCIEHGNFIDPTTAAEMAECGAALVPTLLAYEYDAEHGEKYGYSKEVREKMAIGAERGRDGLRHAFEADVKIGSGSDMIGDLVWNMGREIASQAEVIGAANALKAATSVNAEILRVSDRVGSIQRGKLADLVIVDGDPIAHPSLLEGQAAINTVIKGGRIVRSGLVG